MYSEGKLKEQGSKNKENTEISSIVADPKKVTSFSACVWLQKTSVKIKLLLYKVE